MIRVSILLSILFLSSCLPFKMRKVGGEVAFSVVDSPDYIAPFPENVWRNGVLVPVAFNEIPVFIDEPISLENSHIFSSGGSPPQFISFTEMGDMYYSIKLSGNLEVGHWTAIELFGTSQTQGDAIMVRFNIGWLPGNFNGVRDLHDITTNCMTELPDRGEDFQALLDLLYGPLYGQAANDPWELYLDINRDGMIMASDILDFIDGCSGSAASKNWHGVSLPEIP